VTSADGEHIRASITRIVAATDINQRTQIAIERSQTVFTRSRAAITIEREHLQQAEHIGRGANSRQAGLSLLKIISVRSDDAVRIGSVWRRWCPIVERLV